MAVKKILTYPNPVLRQKTRTVTAFDDELKKLVADMAETMYAAPGAGLAANQIGVDVQVAVINVSENKENKKFLALINPEIFDCLGSQVDEEGCLSVRDLEAKVKRFRKIMVRAQDLAGKITEFEAEEHFARVIQHEVDHLQGVLFLDRISSLKRSLYKRRLKKELQIQLEEES